MLFRVIHVLARRCISFVFIVFNWRN